MRRRVLAFVLSFFAAFAAFAANPVFRKTATVVASDVAHDVLKSPVALAVDRLTGDIVVADRLHHRVLRVSASGEVQPLAGTGAPGRLDGSGVQAQFKEPSGVAIDHARRLIYVADSGNHLIRTVTFDGLVGTLAGSGQPDARDGVGIHAGFKEPRGVAVDASGMIIVADTGNSRIRQITPSGIVTTLAGDVHEGLADGRADIAQFKQPEGIAVGPDGAHYIADTKNNVVRRLRNGNVTTIAGTGRGGSINGAGNIAEFNEPSGITCDEAGNLYVGDAHNHSIRRVAATGTVTTVAGSAKAGFVDGNLTEALFRAPRGIAFAGALYIADTGNDAIRRIDAAVTVDSVDPHFGPAAGGTEVHIVGSGFVPGATSVAFADTAAASISYVTSSEVVVTTPGLDAGIFDVNVTTPGGSATLPAAFATIPPPTIATLSPTKGATSGGLLVTITGTNFTTEMTVRFGGMAATGVAVLSSNSLTAITPANIAGAVDVTVITGGGTATRTAAFTYLAPPVIANFSPMQGTPGTVVTINGANFDPDLTGDVVLFGSARAVVTAASQTQLIVTVPNGATTGRLTAATAGGTAISAADFSTTTYTSLEITTPVTSFEEGDSVPFNAIARLLDGSTADVSALATWTTSDGNVVTVTDGRVTGRVAGTATITAKLSGFTATKSIVIRVSTVPIVIPSKIDQTVVQPFVDTIRFLYSGPNAIQTGVASGAISEDRVTTIRGSVHTRDGVPLAGVEITIAKHPELGHTFTRADGQFDLALNGGGSAALIYRKSGWLTAQRLVTSQWNEQKVVRDVVLIPFDGAATLVTMGVAAAQTARASTVTDTDGVRRATLIIPAGESATMVAADGSTTPVSSLHIRATEYTTGTTGPSAMPAPLPPMSAYTYCVELSADEATGGTVQFTKRISLYFENFLGFPVGTVLPVGYFDHAKNIWIASRNGRVIKILTVNNGVANIDVNGDDVGDSDVVLSQIGIDVAERKELAATYVAGQSLWRASIDHFTPWDINSPVLPAGTARPKVRKPKPGAGKTQVNCKVGGWSVIDCANQTLGESIPLQGTPYALEYDSSRAARNQYSTEIELSDATVPERLRAIELQVSIAGAVSTWKYPPLPNLKHTFTWDGRDGFGRLVQGARAAEITIIYYYPIDYGSASVDPAWNTPANASVPSTAVRDYFTLSQDTQVILGHFDVLNAGFGGWTFSAQRQYDGMGRTIYEAGGDQRSGDPQQTGETAINTLTLGAVSIPDLFTMAPAPDGTLYFSDGYKIKRTNADGSTADVAGTTSAGFTPDGTQALGNPLDLWQFATGPDGILYVIDATRVRAIVNGRWITVAGNSTYEQALQPEGVPATSRSITAWSIAVGPDGALYIGGPGKISRVDPDGIIHTVAGLPFAGGSFTDFVDGALASSVKLGLVKGLAVGRDGTMYFANDVVAGRVTPEGRLFHLIAGTERPLDPHAVSVASDGTILVTDVNGKKIWAIAPDGSTSPFAGTGLFDVSAPPQSAGMSRSFTLRAPTDAKVAADGSVFIIDEGLQKIRQAGATFPPSRASVATVVPSESGEVAYVFQAGRHVRTVDSVTGVTLETLGYDAAGHLATITDVDGLVTHIERDAAGDPTAVVAANGQRTQLGISHGQLDSITPPSGPGYVLSYNSAGLLSGLVDRRGESHEFIYDEDGLLTRDGDPAGGFISLTRVAASGGTFAVSRTSAEGRTHSYSATVDAHGTALYAHTAPDGTTTTSTILGGSKNVAFPTGNISLTLGPDPRFGMLAPITNVVVTDGSKTARLTTTRSVTLADPSNVLSVQSIAETASVNDHAWTATWSTGDRLLMLRSPAGRQSSATFDPKGRVVLTHQASFIDGVTAYDPRGRVASISRGTRVTTFSYDGLDRLQTVTDPLRRATSFQYDDANRLTAQTLSDGRVVSFTYDTAGNVTSVTPPGRPAHGFSFNAVNLLASYAPPMVVSSGSIVYRYNKDRQLTEIARPDAQTISLNYDAAGRLKVLRGPDGVLTYGYDTASRMVSILHSNGVSLSYAYDGSRLVSQSWTGEVSGVVSVSYDSDLRVASENGVAFSYDQDGLLTGVGSLVMKRDAQTGILTDTTLGSVSDAWSYNSFGEPITYTVRVAGTDALRTEYTRDDAGRIKTATETTGGRSVVTSYTYDAAGRLERVIRDGSEIAAYQYDANGNRIGGTYDEQDRLLQQGGVTYTYTKNGELATRSDAGGTSVFSYDAFGNLRRVLLSNGKQIDYIIDAKNRRVGRKVDGTFVAGWLYADQHRVVAEVGASGAIIKRFVYGSRSNVPDYMAFNGVNYRIVSDRTGSPRFVLEASSGSVVQAITYDAFGNVLSDTNPGFQPFGFAGGLADSDTHLIRFGARDYDPSTGRWITRDPAGFEGGDTNLYGYVLNDPINLIDPIGLYSVDNLVEDQANFWAGFGDSLTFGGTRLIRDLIGGNEGLDRCSGAYRGGMYAELGFEIALQVGSAGMASAAEGASRGAVRAAAARETAGMMRGEGQALHHLNPLFGHPGGAKAVFPTGGLPASIHSGSWNIRAVDAAEHAAMHARLRGLENGYRLAVNPATTSGRAALDVLGLGKCGCGD